MEVKVTNPLGKVWEDGFSPIIFTVINRQGYCAENLKQLFDAQVELSRQLLKRFESSFLIVDISELAAEQDSREATIHDYFVRLKKNGVVDIFFVTPCEFHRKRLSAVLGKMRKSWLFSSPVVSFAGSFMEALFKINQTRMPAGIQ